LTKKIKAPSSSLLLKWINDAWIGIPKEMVNSFKVAGKNSRL